MVGLCDSEGGVTIAPTRPDPTPPDPPHSSSPVPTRPHPSPPGEDSECCVTCGKLGLSGSDGEVDLCHMSVPRHKLMYSAFVVSVVGLIFMIVAACAVSTDAQVREPRRTETNRKAVPQPPTTNRQPPTTNHQPPTTRCPLGLNSINPRSTLQVVKNTCWSTGSPNEFVDVYVGLSGVAYQLHDTGTDEDGKLKFTNWEDYECSSGDADLCDKSGDCKTAATGLIATAILGAVTQLGQLTTDLQRSTIAGDLNCQKTMGIVTVGRPAANQAMSVLRLLLLLLSCAASQLLSASLSISASHKPSSTETHRCPRPHPQTLPSPSSSNLALTSGYLRPGEHPL